MIVASKKITKKDKRRFFLLGTLSLLIIVSLVTSISNYWIQIHKKGIEKQFLQEQLANLKEEEGRLTTEVNRLQDPEYIARYARERFLYSKDGEYIIRIP
jgi:cell division protein DivIC